MFKGNIFGIFSASVVAACTILGVQGVAYAYGPHSGNDSSPKSDAIHYLTELSERRRLTTIFHNEQSPFYGVQIGYTNTGEGNLTFLNRDLVRLDRVPIVFGRIYDSRLHDTADFGPGWKLAVTETLIRKGNKFEYTDSSNSTYILLANGKQLASEHPHLTGVSGGQLLQEEIIVRHLGMVKRFSRYKNNKYRLTDVTDNSGNVIFLHYTNGLLSSISSINDRRIDISRNTDSRIVRATDDGGRSVSFEYDDNGQLAGFIDTGGESWHYTYDKHGYLTKISDPRNVDTLQAQFSGKKVSRVDVQHKSFSFRYKGHKTEVADALDRTAIFAAHQSGLTQSARDFSGEVTSLVLNNHLEAVSLELNGAAVAHIDYDSDHRQRQIIRFDADGSRIFTFAYAGNLLESIYSNGEPIATYTYDEYENVLHAQYKSSSRGYVRTADGRIDEIRVDGVVLGTHTNQFGVVTELTRDGQPVAAFSFDAADRIENLDVWDSGNPYRMSFEYAPSGFRTLGRYADDVVFKFDYDAVGNLTTLDKDFGEGPVYEYEYSVGARNELHKVQASYGDPISYQYDALGRVSNIVQGNRRADVNYDDVGRLIGIAFDGAPRFTIEYGPMDMDAIEAADTKSNNTFVPYPISSHVFGSLNSIAYARSRGSLHGAIRFNPTMLRFVIAEEPFAQPDGVDFASFKRRMLPLGEGELSASPLGFDKPSNNLFLPPEFYSSNCAICAGASSGATIKVNNSTLPTSASVGQTVTFKVTSDSFCEEYEEKWYPSTLRHAFQFGDGAGQVKNGSLSFATFTHSYSNSGTYLASYNVKCSCNPLFTSSDTHVVNIIGPPAPQINIVNTMFIPLNHVKLPSWLQLAPIVFFGGDNKLTHSLGQNTYRIQQQIAWNPGTNTLSKAATSGTTHSYLPSANLSSTLSCVRKNCPTCPTYGTEDIIYQGRCKTGSSYQSGTAGGMNTITASVINQTSTSITIRFSGEPYNILVGPSQWQGDIDWLHTLKLDWSQVPYRWTLNYQHDGFPYHDISLNGQKIRQFDPILNNQTPLSLAGTGSGEWIGSATGTF